MREAQLWLDGVSNISWSSWQSIVGWNKYVSFKYCYCSRHPVPCGKWAKMQYFNEGQTMITKPKICFWTLPCEDKDRVKKLSTHNFSDVWCLYPISLPLLLLLSFRVLYSFCRWLVDRREWEESWDVNSSSRAECTIRQLDLLLLISFSCHPPVPLRYNAGINTNQKTVVKSLPLI